MSAPATKGPAWFAAQRAETRLAAAQALYQLELSGRGASAVAREFLSHHLVEDARAEHVDAALFTELVEGAVAAQSDIDAAVTAALAEGWKLERLDATVRAILRVATYELLRRPDAPARSLINAYVDVARAFFEDDAETKFVNAALDGLARRVRASEFGQAS